jgi:hypothetical protein
MFPHNITLVSARNCVIEECTFRSIAEISKHNSKYRGNFYPAVGNIWFISLRYQLAFLCLRLCRWGFHGMWKIIVVVYLYKTSYETLTYISCTRSSWVRNVCAVVVEELRIGIQSQSRFQAWHGWSTRRQDSASEKHRTWRRIGTMFQLILTVPLNSVWSWYGELLNVTHFDVC